MTYIKHIKNIVYLSVGLYVSAKLLNDQELYYYVLSNLGDSNAMYNLGEFYEEKNEHINMIKYYKLSSDAGNASASYKLAKYYEYTMDYKNMTIYYLYSIGGGNQEAIKSYANYLYKTNKYIEALSYYILIDSNDNTDLEYINNVSNCYYKLNIYNETSERFYKLKIKNDPKSSLNLIKKLVEYYTIKNDYENLIMCNLLLVKNNDMSGIIKIFNNDFARNYYIKYLQTQNVIQIYDKNCPVCLNENNEIINPVILSCGHTYCLECLLHLAKYTHFCSLCKSVIS